MRSVLLVFIISITFLVGCRAESPADGHVEGGAYQNSFLRFSYVWPKPLQPVDSKSLNLPHTPSQDEFLLFSAKQGNEPFGVVIIAERLHVPTQHTNGIQDGADFLNKVIRSWDTSGKVLRRTRVVGSNGLSFDELDYFRDNGYGSAITTQIGQFLVAFRCNAKTESDLLEMVRSVLASRRETSQR